MTDQLVPLWLKVAYTAYVAILVPMYASRAGAGPRNLLWFSDLALLVTCAALWLESSLLASMMAVGTLLLEVLWNVDYFFRLITHRTLFGMTSYMFDRTKPWYMRALSLFHVFMPVVVVFLVVRLGYDPAALLAQTLFAWVVVPVTYLTTRPEHNINRVFGLGSTPQQRVPPLAHLAFVMIGLPVLVYWPSHVVLQMIFGR